MSTTGAAVPGTSVPASSLVTPAGAQGIQGIQGPTAVSANSGNQATLGTDSLIYVPDPTPTITGIRLRSFNAAGNPCFEVDQRTAHTGITMGSNTWATDRWMASKAGMATAVATAVSTAGGMVIPGVSPSFQISNYFLRVTITTPQASLAAGDLLWLDQIVEGINFRELANGHSVTLLVRSSVANLSFGLALRDANAAYSLVKLCTIPTAATWTLIPLANLASWAASGTFNLSPGSAGYHIGIGLAAGTTYIAPANDVWQTGNFVGAVGQSNFAASPANSTFDIAFVQHCPGSNTDLIDKPFQQNYDEVLRYYQKTYSYGVAQGSTNANGSILGITAASSSPLVPISFKKTMAKAPTVGAFSATTGAAGNVRDYTASVDKAVSASQLVGDSGFGGFAVNTPNAATWQYGFHYTADTGW